MLLGTKPDYISQTSLQLDVAKGMLADTMLVFHSGLPQCKWLSRYIEEQWHQQEGQSQVILDFAFHHKKEQQLFKHKAPLRDS